MCETCAYRPEMIHCSQCRTPLFAPNGTVILTRNRALEELARRTFPVSEEESSLTRSRGPRTMGGRGRGRGVRMEASTARSEFLRRLNAAVNEAERQRSWLQEGRVHSQVGAP